MQRTLTGLKWGGIMGALLSLWVLILIPVNGSAVFRSRDGAEYFAASIIAVYMLGGILAGALLGSMAGLLRGKVGSFCLGVLATVPVGSGILVTENHFATWTRADSITLLLLAVCLGGPGGLIIREFVARSTAEQ